MPSNKEVMTIEQGAEGVPFETVESFDELPGLHEMLLSRLFSCGLEKPSPMQARGIQALLVGRDTIVQGLSGAGKTTTLVIASLQKIDYLNSSTQILVLAPTRTAATAIQKSGLDIGVGLNVRAHACVGGTSIRDEKKSLQEGQQLVVGTPGRVLDMLKKGCLKVGSLQLFALEEADELLSRNFEQQVHEVFQFLPPAVQVALFSAKMTPDVADLAAKFQRGPAVRVVDETQKPFGGVRQCCIAMETEDCKLGVLCDLLMSSSSTKQALVFCNTRRKVDWLSEEMTNREVTNATMHAELKRTDRSRILEEFRGGAFRVLISTDLLPGSSCNEQTPLVINYDLPANIVNYLHRVDGRAGRFGGGKCSAITFLTCQRDADGTFAKQDLDHLKDIENHFHIQIDDVSLDECKKDLAA